MAHKCCAHTGGGNGPWPSRRVSPSTPEKIKKNTRRTDKGFGVSSKAGLTENRQLFFLEEKDELRRDVEEH